MVTCPQCTGSALFELSPTVVAPPALRGAAEDSRPHSLPSPLSLAFALGQRTLKPLQLLGLAHPASFVVTELCGSSGHHRSPVGPGQGQEEERRLMSGLFRAKWTAGGRLCFTAPCGLLRAPAPATLPLAGNSKRCQYASSSVLRLSGKSEGLEPLF